MQRPLEKTNLQEMQRLGVVLYDYNTPSNHYLLEGLSAHLFCKEVCTSIHIGSVTCARGSEPVSRVQAFAIGLMQGGHAHGIGPWQGS